MLQHGLLFRQLCQFMGDVFAADLPLVGTCQKFGGALLRLAVLARVLLLLLHQVFMLHFGRAHGGFRLFERSFGGGKFGGKVFQFGRDAVKARFLGNQAFLRRFCIEQDADFIDLMAFGREPDLVCAQIALMREGRSSNRARTIRRRANGAMPSETAAALGFGSAMPVRVGIF